MNYKKGVLNRNFEFHRVYKNGESIVGPTVVIYVWRRSRGGIKTGITASKKIGCAVERNRARRVVKSAAAEVLKGVGGNYHLVFVCRRRAITTKSTTVAGQLKNQLTEAGVLN